MCVDSALNSRLDEGRGKDDHVAEWNVRTLCCSRDNHQMRSWVAVDDYSNHGVAVGLHSTND